jgi:hypothetical protein
VAVVVTGGSGHLYLYNTVSMLPRHLVHSILLLSLALAQEDAASLGESTAGATSTSPSEPITTQLTLWDVGFSLRDKWADLRLEEECPVHLDLPEDPDLMQEGDFDQSEASTNATTTPLGSNQSDSTSTVNETAPDDFVSFEDWKRKKLEQDEEEGDASELKRISSESDDSSSTRHSTERPLDTTITFVNDSKVSSKDWSPKAANNSSDIPHKPAHKYNYASPDCSARIHSSSSSTQHASSLLHKSRDRYMLTPCKADEHWVVVELCDEIRIEAVEVAVWEFFSGVVREVRVSVGGEDEEEAEDEAGDDVNGRGKKWEEVGAFVGKNVRGVQVSGICSKRGTLLTLDVHLEQTYRVPSIHPT